MATKTADETVLVCAMGHSSPAGVFPQGTRLVASHPAVAAAPALWVADGTLPSEWPSPFDDAVNAAAQAEAKEAAERAVRFEAAAKANPIQLSVPELVEAVADFATDYQGRPALIRKGSQALATDAIVTRDPARWTAAQPSSRKRLGASLRA